MKILDSRQGYDLYAANYRKDHAHLDSFDWDVLQPMLANLLSDIIAEKNGQTARLLDLGCGDGRILKRIVRLREQRAWIDKLELHGWDISDGMLKQARKVSPDCILEQHDLLDPVTSSVSFSLIYSFFVLVHISHPGDFLKAAYDLLEPGGNLVFNNIPQKEALVLESQGQKFRIEYEHHESTDIEDCLQDCGFKLIERRQTDWSDLFVLKKAVS